MIVERVDGADELVASMVKLAVQDLRTAQPHTTRYHTAAVFFDEAGLLEGVCRIHSLDYETAVTSLIEGPRYGRTRKGRA